MKIFNNLEAGIITHKKQKNNICLFYETHKHHLENLGCNLKIYIVKHDCKNIYLKFYGPLFYLCGKHLRKINNIFNIDFLKEGYDCLVRKQYDKTSEYIFEKGGEFPIRSGIGEKIIIDTLKDFFDAEKVLWQLDAYLIGLPFDLLMNFKLKKFIGSNSKIQGSENGPDYIFENNKGETIGLEIVEIGRVNFNSIKKSNIYESKIEKILISSFVDVVNEAKRVVTKKESKINLYQKTDKIYLGIVVSQLINDWLILLLEILLNKETKFDGIFIL